LDCTPREVRATLPDNGDGQGAPRIDTTYQQSFACLGRASRSDQFDGAGTLLRREEQTFTLDLNEAPLLCLPASTYTYHHDGSPSGSPRTTRLQSVFDLWGNQTRDIDHGDLATNADGAYSSRSFYPDTARFITGCEARRIVYAGTATSGAKLADTLRYHKHASGSEVLSAPPERCEETRTAEWLEALRRALADVPRQARRLFRARARRHKVPSLRLQSPMRPGRPPGHRKVPTHDVDHVLAECHWLARDVEAHDTS
jgi:hypothetical protein